MGVKGEEQWQRFSTSSFSCLRIASTTASLDCRPSLATCPGSGPTTANGLPGQPIVNFGRTGTRYQLGTGSPYALGFDPGHEFTDTCVQLSAFPIPLAHTLRTPTPILG